MQRSDPRTRLRALAALAALAVGALHPSHAERAAASTSAAPGAPPNGELSWRRVEVRAADDVVTALAIDRSGRLAVGDARGVAIGFPGSPLRRVALRGEVLDLAFAEWGAEREPPLLAATPLGLRRIWPDGRVESIAPGPGADANAIARVAVAGAVVAVATAAGAFVSLEGERWQRLSEALPSGPATAIALAQREGFVACWVAVAGELWRVELRASPQRVASAVRLAIPFTSGQRPPIDIAPDVGEAALAVVFDDALVVHWRHTARWEPLRPALPPGASARRLLAALDRYWLATDRGLLVAANLRGPWRRAQHALGSDAIFDLEFREGALYAGSENGLAVARLAGDPSAGADSAQRDREAPPAPGGPPLAPDASVASDGAPPAPGISSDARSAPPASDFSEAAPAPQPFVDPNEPDVHSVHRAALRYLSLDGAPIAALRRGVARRGWLPVVSLRATADSDRGRRADYDEAFVSGEMRRFNDFDHDRNRELELQLVVSWDLGDVAYHPESIDVSREAREVIELRDDVLDEITQLYFERRRVLALVASAPDSPAAGELRLRAAQLVAGIDAWTGGWYGRQLSDVTR